MRDFSTLTDVGTTAGRGGVVMAATQRCCPHGQRWQAKSGEVQHLSGYATHHNMHSGAMTNDTEQPEIKDEEGNLIQEYRPAGNRYGIRYDELTMFILAAI